MSSHAPAPRNLLEVPVTSLKPGMYIAELDRPWLETPFSLQGFFVKDREDIEFVTKHANFVMVDPGRYEKPDPAERKRTHRRTYRDQTSLKNEFQTARLILKAPVGP